MTDKDETWMDKFKSISWETWLAEFQYVITHYDFKEKEMSVLHLSQGSFSMFVSKPRLDLDKKMILARDIIARNTTHMLNPAIQFNDVAIKPNLFASYGSYSVNMNGFNSFLDDMIDYKPLRFEFFKNPVDLINFTTIVGDFPNE